MTTTPDFSQLANPFIHYSRSYFEKIKSTLITKEDLKILYKQLAKKSDEAAELQMKITPSLSNDMKEVFRNFKGKLWVEIWGKNNEYISGDHESVFNDNRLPNKIIRIRFNSYKGYQIAMQNNMQNWFEIELDFSKIKIFDFSKTNNLSNQNDSCIKVIGTDETWVDGVYQAINSFLKERTLKRNWIYSSITYDAVLYLLVFPLALRVAYKFGLFLRISALPSALEVAFYIYIFIILLFGFRIIFNYTKWIFPIIELKNGNSTIHRGVLAVIVLGVITSAIYDVCKALPHLLFS